jgi:protein-disulfide isomerase
MPEDGPSRRSLLKLGVGLASAASVGLAGCNEFPGRDSGTPVNEPQPSDGPGGETPTPTGEETAEPTASPTPGSAADVATLGVFETGADYAHLGSADAEKTATLYGGWKCPYTREFVRTMFPAVIEAYVSPGDLAIEFRAVRFLLDESYGDDEPRANRAGLAVWHESPEQFPAYMDHLYANQPGETKEWATAEQLTAFAEAAGVKDTAPIEKAMAEGTYNDLWQESQSLVAEKGITGIPRLELDGTVTAPTINPAETETQLKNAFR